MFVLCARIHAFLGCRRGECEKALGFVGGEQAGGVMDRLGPEEGADTVTGGCEGAVSASGC